MNDIPDYYAMFKAMSKEQQQQILNKVLRLDLRELEGEELEHTWLFLQFLEPSWVSNNQQLSSAHYVHNGQIYHVHFIGGDIPMIEVEPDKDAYLNSGD